jgi:hypothetical protein
MAYKIMKEPKRPPIGPIEKTGGKEVREFIMIRSAPYLL